MDFKSGSVLSNNSYGILMPDKDETNKNKEKESGKDIEVHLSQHNDCKLCIMHVVTLIKTTEL